MCKPLLAIVQPPLSVRRWAGASGRRILGFVEYTAVEVNALHRAAEKDVW